MEFGINKSTVFKRIETAKIIINPFYMHIGKDREDSGRSSHDEHAK